MFGVVIAALALALFSGCAMHRRASDLPPVIRSNGFSVERPPNDQWVQSVKDLLLAPNAVRFRREVLGTSHVFSFHAEFMDLEAVANSERQFAERVFAIRRQWVRLSHMLLTEGGVEPEGLEITHYEAQPVLRQGVFCLRLVMTATDRSHVKSPEQIFHTSVRGIACRDPQSVEHALVAIYLERGLAHEMNRDLAAEGESLVGGVQILDEDGTVYSNAAGSFLPIERVRRAEVEALLEQHLLDNKDALEQGTMLVEIEKEIDDGFDATFSEFLVENQRELIPLASYMAADRLVQRDRDEALFWFAVGGLRARYDALRCENERAVRGVSILAFGFAKTVAEAGQADRQAAASAGLRAIAWEGLFDYSTEPSWICIHSLSLTPEISPRSYLPESEWPGIRTEILRGAKASYLKFASPADD